MCNLVEALQEPWKLDVADKLGISGVRERPLTVESARVTEGSPVEGEDTFAHSPTWSFGSGRSWPLANWRAKHKTRHLVPAETEHQQTIEKANRDIDDANVEQAGPDDIDKENVEQAGPDDH